jgi:poly(hydroxyalkanoate) granule-associated protein
MADTKRKAKQIGNEFSQQLESVYLAGLGAFANAQKMGTETFDALVKDGEKFRKQASKRTERLIDEAQSNLREIGEDAQDRAEGLLDRVRESSRFDKLQDAFDRRVADTMDRLNVPSKNDIDKINKKLNKILRSIEAQGKPAATKRKTASRKTASKKTAPKKAASRKTARKKAPAKAA